MSSRRRRYLRGLPFRCTHTHTHMNTSHVSNRPARTWFQTEREKKAVQAKTKAAVVEGRSGGGSDDEGGGSKKKKVC